MASSDETLEPEFAVTDALSGASRPARSRALLWGAVVIAVIAVIAVAVPAIVVQLKKSELAGELQRRLEILAAGRVDVVSTWLKGVARPADRVVNSELFRLFATEMDLAGGDISDLAGQDAPPGNGASGDTPPTGLGVPLADQLPFMAQVLSDFTTSADYVAGYLIGRNGVSYVTSAGARTITPDQQAIALAVAQTGQSRYGPVRSTAAGLVMDIYAPVFAAQADSRPGAPVGVFLLTTAVGEILSEILTPPPLAEPGERLRLLQRDGGGLSEIAPGEAPPLRPLPAFRLAAGAADIPFARRARVGGGAPVYSVGAAMADPPWILVQEVDARLAETKLDGFVTAAVLVAGLVVVTVIAAFGAFWWRLSNEHNAALAAQFRRLAARIQAQKKLLDSINSTITDYIGLKSLDGTYRYINPAFARAIGRDGGKVTGLDDAAVFGEDTAQRLKVSDQRALSSGAAVMVGEQAYLGSRLRHLQISKVPYHDEEGRTAGIVSVARDVTELVEAQQKKEKAVAQTVAALVRAVELRDPYLAGHSRRVAGFARAVAERLQVRQEDIAAVEIAASLSQIGKLAVPRAVLTKTTRLEEAEIRQMQEHVGHAARILRDIDFELPVLETVCQMHERLDGGGYPEGLSGDRIRMTARILGACDVFCARIEPRAYRAAISPAEALEILRENSGRYDPKVVAALSDVAGSIVGEKLIAGAAGA